LPPTPALFGGRRRVDRGSAFIIPFAEGERLKCGSSSGAVR
jgi:hypothetical protein